MPPSPLYLSAQSLHSHTHFRQKPITDNGLHPLSVFLRLFYFLLLLLPTSYLYYSVASAGITRPHFPLPFRVLCTPVPPCPPSAAHEPATRLFRPPEVSLSGSTQHRDASPRQRSELVVRSSSSKKKHPLIKECSIIVKSCLLLPLATSRVSFLFPLQVLVRISHTYFPDKHPDSSTEE